MDWNCFIVSTFMFFIGGIFGIHAGAKGVWNGMRKDLSKEWGVEVPEFDRAIWEIIKQKFKK